MILSKLLSLFKLSLRFIYLNINLLVSFALGFIFCLFVSNINCSKKAVTPSPSEQTPLKITTDKKTKPLSLEEEYPEVLGRNTPLYTHLTKLGVSSIDIIDVVKTSKPIKNLSMLLPGTRFKVFQDETKNLTQINFRFSPLEKLEVKKVNEKWDAKIIKEPVKTSTVSYSGTVESSLWDSSQKAKMPPYLVVTMAEIFAWEIDFSREVRTGDKWRLVAEEKSINGERVGFGSILAAEYINEDTPHSAVLFKLDDNEMGYYNKDGKSLRKMFLKSPLKFGRVTSRFNKRRFHPKLKRIRPHNGVDYGAPIGTPVRSVADGVVTFTGRRGGGGKVLKIKHNSTYKTAYKHLSRYKVKKGERVKQGQIVALTGNTGLSTGPHLHYEFFINNKFVDPLRQTFPNAKPLSKEHKEEFAKQASKALESLPKWPTAKAK